MLQADKWMIAINGQHFTEYVHRIPYEQLTAISIDGDCTADKLSFSGTEQMITSKSADPYGTSSVPYPVGGPIGFGMPTPDFSQNFASPNMSHVPYPGGPGGAPYGAPGPYPPPSSGPYHSYSPFPPSNQPFPSSPYHNQPPYDLGGYQQGPSPYGAPAPYGPPPGAYPSMGGGGGYGAPGGAPPPAPGYPGGAPLYPGQSVPGAPVYGAGSSSGHKQGGLQGMLGGLGAAAASLPIAGALLGHKKHKKMGKKGKMGLGLGAGGLAAGVGAAALGTYVAHKANPFRKMKKMKKGFGGGWGSSSSSSSEEE